MLRIPFGLERLPRTIGVDDPRLPAADVDSRLLRLNSEPLSMAIALEAADGHAAKVKAAFDCLASQCGDYAPRSRQFIGAYFAFIAAQIDVNRQGLARALERFDGIYSPDDWLWSAPRPLPRAWLLTADGMVSVEIAFWDGAGPLAIELTPNDRRRRSLLEAEIPVLSITTISIDDPPSLGAKLPSFFHRYWIGETLPASPFRLPMPAIAIANAS